MPPEWPSDTARVPLSPTPVNDPEEQAAANQIDERRHREISSDSPNIHSQSEEFRKRQEKAC